MSIDPNKLTNFHLSCFEEKIESDRYYEIIDTAHQFCEAFAQEKAFISLSHLDFNGVKHPVLFKNLNFTRSCTTATSNLASSLILSPRANQNIAFENYNIKNINIFYKKFNIDQVIEIKFLRNLHTSLLLILAANETGSTPHRLDTSLQLGSGFEHFQGLHSSFSPEPDFQFDGSFFSDYVRKVINTWLDQTVHSIDEFSKAHTSKDQYSLLTSILFGPSFELFLAFFTPSSITAKLSNSIADYAKSIEPLQIQFLKIYSSELEAMPAQILDQETLKSLNEKVLSLKNDFVEALSKALISPKNLLKNSHFHFSNNAVDVLPASLNQFDCMLESVMRKKLIEIAHASAEGNEPVEELCNQFVKNLHQSVIDIAKELETQKGILEDLLVQESKLDEIEIQLQATLEEFLVDLDSQKSKKAPEFFALLFEKKAIATQYFNYILLINEISSTLDRLEKVQRHPQTILSVNHLNKSINPSLIIYQEFFKAIAPRSSDNEINFWKDLKDLVGSKEKFLKNKFSFFYEITDHDQSSLLASALTIHFKRLNIELRTKIYGIDLNSIEEKTKRLQSLVAPISNQNENNSPLFTSLIQASFLLFTKEDASQWFLKPIHNLCKKITIKSLDLPGCRLHTLLDTPYIHRAHTAFNPEPTAKDASNTPQKKKLKKNEEPKLPTSALFNHVGTPDLNLNPIEQINAYYAKLKSHTEKSDKPREASLLIERIEFARNNLLPFLEMLLRDDSIPLRCQRNIRTLINTYTLDGIISGQFFIHFAQFVLIPQAVPPPSSALKIGIFLQYVLMDADQYGLLDLTDDPDTPPKETIAQYMQIINKVIEESLKTKEAKHENYISTTSTISNLSFILNQGIPKSLKVAKEFSIDTLKPLLLSEIPVQVENKKELDLPVLALSRQTLSKRPINQLCYLLFASIINNRFEPQYITLENLQLAGSMISTQQDRFNCQVLYRVNDHRFFIQIPSDFKSSEHQLNHEDIAYKIHEVLKLTSFRKTDNRDLIKFKAEIFIDYLNK